MTGVLEVLEEIDVGGIRVAIRNATQVFNNIDALLTAQTNNIGKQKTLVKHKVVWFATRSIFCDISFVFFRHQFCTT